MATLPQIEILLPVYNEVASLVPLVRELDKVFAALRDSYRFRLLFVNDGSTDGSAELLQNLAKKRSDTRVIDLVHNFGHSGALSAGIDHFDADALIMMDADHQDSPDAIGPLVEAWKRGAKTVVVERGKRSERTAFFFQAFYFLLHRLSHSLPPISFGTHCLIDRIVVERLKLLPERNRYLPGLVAYSSGPIATLRLNRGARHSGTSRVGLGGLVKLGVTAILSFSTLPIRFVSALGLGAAALALLAGAFIIGLRLFTDLAIPGWASLMTAIAFASGIQLFCVGLIGEYVALIYEEVKRRPPYYVAAIHGTQSQARKTG